MIFEIKKVKNGSNGRKEDTTKRGKLFGRSSPEIRLERGSDKGCNHTQRRDGGTRYHAKCKVHQKTNSQVTSPCFLVESSRQCGQDAYLDACCTDNIVVHSVRKKEWGVHGRGTIFWKQFGSLETIGSSRTLTLDQTNQMLLLKFPTSVERLGIVTTSDKGPSDDHHREGRMAKAEAKKPYKQVGRFRLSDFGCLVH